MANLTGIVQPTNQMSTFNANRFAANQDVLRRMRSAGPGEKAQGRAAGHYTPPQATGSDVYAQATRDGAAGGPPGSFAEFSGTFETLPEVENLLQYITADSPAARYEQANQLFQELLAKFPGQEEEVIARFRQIPGFENVIVEYPE